MFPIDSHNTSYLYLREDGTYYWQHCRKEAEDDVFIDADGIQLDLFGKPVLNKDLWIKIDEFNNKFEIKWTWVKAHQSTDTEDSYFNNMADELATGAITK